MREVRCCFVLLLIAATIGLEIAVPSLAQTSTERVADGLSAPLFATSPPGDNARLFIAEKGLSGTAEIKILDLTTGEVNSEAYLTINGLTTTSERGLLGLAFHPDFSSNGRFYVYLSVPGGPWNHQSKIRQYQALGDPLTSNSADTNPSTIQPILTIDQPSSGHNGGWIGFNPKIQPNDEQFLYIATGDGGGSNDSGTNHTPFVGNAQDTTNNLLGKILRIDIDGDDFLADSERNYAIPNDNPFVGQTGDDEIWSYGLRNPYRDSFDRETGDLWIGDVGQGAREEINRQPASSPGGENYGWRLREGFIQTPASGIGGPKPAGSVDPIYDYPRLGIDPAFVGNVVTGGQVYRGPVAAFQGHYFFADYGSNNIWKLDPDAIDLPASATDPSPPGSVTRVNGLLTPDIGSMSSVASFGEDNEGNLYLLDLNGGKVFKIVTTSKDIVWNGDDASAGVAGDGMTWNDQDNWTRDGTPDVAFVEDDHVIFDAGSSETAIQLQTDRTVAATTFDAPYSLSGSTQTLTVLSGNVTVAENVTATIDASLSAETADHSIRKLGPGKLLVNNTTGQTAVKAGTLGGTGTLDYLTVQAGGTVAPGASFGTLVVANDYRQAAGGTLAIEIGGLTPGTQFDQLDVGGEANLDGTLDVQTMGSYTGPAEGAVDTFKILDANAINGTFADEPMRHRGEGLFGDVVYQGNRVDLEFLQALAGDADGDRDVDIFDILAINEAGQFGQGNVGADWTTGDFVSDALGTPGDGDVDFFDILAINTTIAQIGGFGSAYASPSAFQAVVPEPASLVHLGFAVAGLAISRRRRL